MQELFRDFSALFDQTDDLPVILQKRDELGGAHRLPPLGGERWSPGFLQMVIRPLFTRKKATSTGEISFSAVGVSMHNGRPY